MEKVQLAGNGLAAVVLLSSLGNTIVKPVPADVNGKLDKIIQQNNELKNVVNLNTYRIQQLENEP